MGAVVFALVAVAATATLVAGSAGDEDPTGGADSGRPPPSGESWAEAKPTATARRAAALDRRLERIDRSGRTPIALLTRRTPLRAAPAGRRLERLGTETEFRSPKVLAVVGHEDAWLEVMAPELANGETGWVRFRDTDVGAIGYSLHASLAGRELEVRREDEVLRRVPVAVGAPDTPTPTGAYAVTDKLQVTDPASPYGCCALAFTGHQPEVPQGWSGGDRLALHATSDPASVGDAVSLGCLRAAEKDMRWLVDRVPLGTPVTITR